MTPLQKAQAAKEAFLQIASFSLAQKNAALEALSYALEENTESLLSANAQDMAAAEILVAQKKLSPAAFGRLKLDAPKICGLRQGIADLIAMEDPIGRSLMSCELDEGLILRKVSCPLGVIGVIFEARPDVLPQITALALKSSNAVLLKGGAETLHTNRAMMELIRQVLESAGYPAAAVTFLETREEAAALLSMDTLIDLIIPRGGNDLVRFVKDHTKIPVLGHADGVCHIYIAPSAPKDMAVNICLDAKLSYPTACNAVECLLIHKDWPYTPQLLSTLHEAGVSLRGNASIQKIGKNIAPASDEDWGKEYSDTILAVKTVGSLSEAVNHINTFGSRHTDAILTADADEAETFLNNVDSAGVYHNASPRFADGYRYGFGAEVGISTGKTHARGPVGLDGLTIYKYKLYGSGQGVGLYTGPNARSFRHRPIS